MPCKIAKLFLDVFPHFFFLFFNILYGYTYILQLTQNHNKIKKDIYYLTLMNLKRMDTYILYICTSI